MIEPLRLGINMILARTHAGESYVLSSDYDALAARLAEAERLLFHAKDLTPHPGKFFEAEVLRQRIDAFMETTGSASVSEL
jgi:hypothetical protein